MRTGTSVVSSASAACTMSSVVVEGTTYYRCGRNWFQKALSNGEVTYLVVNPPPGY